MSQVVDELWELQDLMSQLAEKERKLNEKPTDFAEVDAEYSASLAEIEGLEARLENASKEKRAVESDLQDCQELLKKYQGQLMQVKNQQQYAAAWKEIDTSRKQVKEYEDTFLKHLSDSEEMQKQIDEKRDSASPLKEKWEESYKRWQGSLGELKKEAERLKKSVSEREQKIPKNVLSQFQRVAKQRQGFGMTKIVNDSCSLCRFKMRSQAMQQLMRGELITCEGCHRFCYFEKVS